MVYYRLHINYSRILTLRIGGRKVQTAECRGLRVSGDPPLTRGETGFPAAKADGNDS